MKHLAIRLSGVMPLSQMALCLLSFCFYLFIYLFLFLFILFFSPIFVKYVEMLWASHNI